MIVSFSQCPEQRRKQIWGYRNCAFLRLTSGFLNVKSVYSNSFDTLSQNWLSGAEIRGARPRQQNPLEIFLKAKTSPRARSVLPVHWQRQQKAARWTRATKRGVGTCCSRFAGAEGVIERMKGREGRWDTLGGPLFVHRSVPASPTLDQHWRSTFLEPPTPPTLLYSPGFPPDTTNFPIFLKRFAARHHKRITRRPFLCNSLHRFLELLFRECIVRQVRPVFTRRFLCDPDLLGGWNGLFSCLPRNASHDAKMSEKRCRSLGAM